MTDIKKDLIFCTEQRLAYPVLDNFVNKEEKGSLAVQLSRLGLASYQEYQNEDIDPNLKLELGDFLVILHRYTSIAGITDNDTVSRLRTLGGHDGADLDPAAD